METETNDPAAWPSSTRHPGIDHVLPSESLKALAHPLRVQIYDELSTYGPFTASMLAERLGETSGATSYHLRQLERAGLVQEDTTRGKGRERWWERRPGSIAIPDARTLPPGSAERLAVKLVEDEWYRSREQNFREFLAEGEGVFGPDWLDIATSDTITLRLTPDQLHGLVTDIDVVLQKYIRAYKRTPTPGSRPVQVHINAFPLVRGEATDATAPKEAP
ncbi:DNA-binding transcriptional ArsR family regulator [Agromyces flavus]|uniref:DNA-binding transcriptional ArsR family regulator n=1 Tax=Agromyces flavus TaxID=589382 RepID=A0A1H1T971_9MICO|nr:metalloregulator ArsR/SmtB family transcription factor [Agromyces flavus]MCP2368468.1 DNA-binding transcriptional ArsR family regulator [Agromyces flavus]GGI47928.1 transcriptional regulator [Agromyces flavus]SDS56691.1 DNA-binding transcriptional regulator, ArsR family [Agromyces flavus]